MKRWEHGEWNRAMDQKKGMPGLPLAPWRLERSAEWKEIQKASREGQAAPPPWAKTAALRERQQKVEKQLRDHPDLRQAFDLDGAPLTPGPGMPVSVVLAARHDDRITSREILTPRAVFDMASFLREIDSSHNTSEDPRG